MYNVLVHMYTQILVSGDLLSGFRVTVAFRGGTPVGDTHLPDTTSTHPVILPSVTIVLKLSVPHGIFFFHPNTLIAPFF